MYIVHCPYPARQIKKIIQQLIGKGVQRVAKINYVKSYTSKDKKTSLQKEHILYIYCTQEQKDMVKSCLDKNMADCFVVFIEHSIV